MRSCKPHGSCWEKLALFDYTAEILGVVVDLGDASRRKISTPNKPSTLKELDLALRDILESGVGIPNRLPSFLGKLDMPTPMPGGALAS